MNLLHSLVSEQIMNALGWTLFHILWQGTIVAMISAIAMFILRNKASKLRYYTLLVGLFLFVVLSTINFVHYLDYTESSNNYTPVDNLEKNQPDYTEQFKEKDSIQELTVKSSMNNFMAKADRHFPLIVNLWIAGILLFTLKFVLSYFYTSRLKYFKTQPVSEYWYSRFNKIRDKININTTVRYFNSWHVKIPVVIGHFKPVILIPAEMLTGIPSNQIEAIMAHELAHIRRNDYIINVLQTLIETLFFFHPGVWYLSGQLRRERENCCDDLVLSVCTESVVYAKALVAIQEFTLNGHYSAVAFSGNKKHLLNRIKRMIMKPKVKTNFIDKVIVAAIILSVLTALSFTCAAEFNSPGSDMKSEISKTPALSVEKMETKPKQTKDLKDTVRVKNHHHHNIDIENNTIIKTYEDDQGNKRKMKFTLVNGKATNLYVDGEKIPEKDFDQYQPEIDNTIKELKEAKSDIREAMKEIEDLDIQKIKLEIEKAMEDIQVNLEALENIHLEKIEDLDIDVDKVMRDFEREMNELKLEIDMEVEMEKVAESLENMEIELFDYDEFVKNISEIEKKMEEIDREELRAKINASVNSVDVEKIIRELNKTQESLSHLQKEEIIYQMERMTKNLEPHKNDEKIHEMEETLEELEKLELEEK